MERNTDSGIEELMEKSEEIQQLNSHIETFVDENSDRDAYYSINITGLDEDKVTLEAYGVEGGDYPLPTKEVVRDAVGDFFDWSPLIERFEEGSSMFRMHLVPGDNS